MSAIVDVGGLDVVAFVAPPHIGPKVLWVEVTKFLAEDDLQHTTPLNLTPQTGSCDIRRLFLHCLTVEQVPGDPL